MTGFLNPIAAGWAWGGGWLFKLGFHDFSGSGIVHLIGGTAALWGTYICGPRLGRFGVQHISPQDDKEEARELEDFNDINDKIHE